MKLLRFTAWFGVIIWIILTLCFSLFTEMSGDGKRWLLGTAMTWLIGSIIAEMVYRSSR